MSSSLNLHLLIILGYVNIITLMTPHYNIDGLGWSWYKLANEEAHGQGWNIVIISLHLRTLCCGDKVL